MDIFINLDRLPISALLEQNLYSRSFNPDIKVWLSQRSSSEFHDVRLYLSMDSDGVSFTIAALICNERTIGTGDCLAQLKAAKDFLEYKFDDFEEKDNKDRGCSFKFKLTEWEPQTRMSDLWRRNFQRKKPSSEQGAQTPEMAMPQSIVWGEGPDAITQRLGAEYIRYEGTNAIFDNSYFTTSAPTPASTAMLSRGPGSARQQRPIDGPRLPLESDAEYAERRRQIGEALRSIASYPLRAQGR